MSPWYHRGWPRSHPLKLGRYECRGIDPSSHVLQIVGVDRAAKRVTWVWEWWDGAITGSYNCSFETFRRKLPGIERQLMILQREEAENTSPRAEH